MGGLPHVSSMWLGGEGLLFGFQVRPIVALRSGILMALVAFAMYNSHLFWQLCRLQH